MLAAQRRNEAKGLTQPVYGTYVIGRWWFFVILNGQDYTISPSFDCTKAAEVQASWALLQVRVYVEALHLEVEG